MSVLAAVVLAAASARVEAVGLTTAEARLAVRVVLSERPGMVSVHREGTAARVSIADAALGVRFAGGRRFTWTPADGFDPSLLAAPVKLDRIEVVAEPSEVSILLHVPPEISIHAQRDQYGLLLIFRETPTTPEPLQEARSLPRPPPRPTPTTAPEAPTVAATPPPVRAEAAPPEPPAAPPSLPAEAVEAPAFVAEAPAPPPAAAPELPVAESPAPSADTLELARRLFPGAAATAGPDDEIAASTAELYAQLFPTGPPRTRPETIVAPSVEVGPEQGVLAGPFRVRAGVDARFVDADTFVEGAGDPVRDQYLEVVPRVVAQTPVGAGELTLDYMPSLRAFATFDEVNSSSHRVGAEIEAPLGPSVTLRVGDSFVSGVLDTREADPGGEYFFDLGRFHRNTLDGEASILVGPRWSVELGGLYSTVEFKEESSFFDYGRRGVSAGLGYELSPTLKAIFSYVYDEVPTPEDRPEAEARAHSGRAEFIGDILPLVTGRLAFGYREQKNPNAGPGGTSYSGFVMSGSLTKQFNPQASATVLVSRSTPVSAFEENAFYVSTALQGAARVPLPLQLQLQAGLGYQWNDYRTPSAELGLPREDRILGFYFGLRRPIRRQLYLAATYRREERRSNLDSFDTTADGFIFQLQWDVFGQAPR